MFFGKKKKDALPALPRIPQFPAAQQPGMQTAQQTPIHYHGSFEPPPPQRRVAPPLETPHAAQEALNIPAREPAFLQKKQYPQREEAAQSAPSFSPQAQGFAYQRQTAHQPQQVPIERPPQQEHHLFRFRAAPPEHKQEAGMQQRADGDERRERPPVAEEKPVFVKLEQYRDALANIEVLKQKIKETEYLLEKIEEVRAQEQVELSTCHDNLNKLKEKLLAIDKKLFEA